MTIKEHFAEWVYELSNPPLSIKEKIAIAVAVLGFIAAFSAIAHYGLG